jgi:hypothetical protein
MKNKQNLILVALLSLGASSLTAGIANIAYGSVGGFGGSQFFGSDDAAADSVAVGYFAGDVVDATSLSGWTALATSVSFPIGGFSNNSLQVDTTAGDGLSAYVLIVDGGLQAVVALNSWVAITGLDAPATPSALAYTFGAGDSASNITSFAATGTTLTIFDGGGTDFGGGTSGSGVSFTLTAVPEPSTFAALAGLCALGAVMVRRRRA